MKRILAAIFTLLVGISAFAIDFKTVPTRILDTLTSDEIFIGQCKNESELQIILEKGYKEVLGSYVTIDSEKVSKMISSMETKKEYDATLSEVTATDTYDLHHMDFTYSDIVEIFNTFKGRLEKESATYYVSIMKIEDSNRFYIFIYNTKNKKIYMEYDYTRLGY